MKTILAMGQSWADGGQLGGVWGMPASVTVWNSASGSTSTTTGLGTAWCPAVQNSPPFYNNPAGPGNNTMAQAAKYLAQELGENIRLILVTLGGTPIAQWCDAFGTTGPMYARMEAVLAAAGVDEIDGFLWSQGHADIANWATYAAAFNALVARMEADDYIDDETPIVVSELDITNWQMNGVLRGIADSSPRIGIATIAGFPVISPSNLHPTGIAHVRAGLEFARELMKLPGCFHNDHHVPGHAYVTAVGCLQYTIPSSGAPTKIIVKGENGCLNWIVGGGVIVPYTGVYEIDASVLSWAGTYALDILNQNGELLDSLAATDAAGGQHIDGSTVMAFGAGDQLFLGAHGSSSSIVSAITASTFDRLTVKYLGRY